MSFKDQQKELDELSNEGGSGGIAGFISVKIGYKCYIGNMSNEETFFEFPLGDATAKDKAYNDAFALNEEYGAVDEKGKVKKPRPHIAFILNRESAVALGNDRAEDWAGDRWWTYPMWTPAYRDLIQDKLFATEVNVPCQVWGRIAWSDDPSGYEEENQDGEMVVRQIFYLDTLMTDEEVGDAKAAGDFSSSAEAADVPADLKVPEGWEATDWWASRDEIVDDLGDKPKAVDKKRVADEWGVTVAEITSLIKKR